MKYLYQGKKYLPRELKHSKHCVESFAAYDVDQGVERSKIFSRVFSSLADNDYNIFTKNCDRFDYSTLKYTEVRQEAVQQALAAMQGRPKPSLPMPSKRTSVMARSPDRERRDSGESSSDEDSVVTEESPGAGGPTGICPSIFRLLCDYTYLFG